MSEPKLRDIVVIETAYGEKEVRLLFDNDRYNAVAFPVGANRLEVATGIQLLDNLNRIDRNGGV